MPLKPFQIHIVYHTHYTRSSRALIGSPRPQGRHSLRSAGAWFLTAATGEGRQEEGQRDLKELVDTLRESQPAGPLVALCRTLDQAKAVVTFLDSASEKTLRSTVALTASRGRGKSAALGTRERESERGGNRGQQQITVRGFLSGEVCARPTCIASGRVLTRGVVMTS